MKIRWSLTSVYKKMLIHCQVNVQDAVMDMDIDLTELNCEASQVNFFLSRSA